jgi:large subunit ribosomal protein L7/L12
MAELSKDQLVEAISSLTVMELSKLVKALEEKFGISAFQNVINQTKLDSNNNESKEKSEDKTEFNVTLSSIGTSKISVIKIVREITGLGLKESKDLVESVPKVIKENVSKEEAEKIKKKFDTVGAIVELK